MDVKVSQNDLKELRRVYDFLADFAPKHKLQRELQPKLDRRAKIALFLRNPEAMKVVDETGSELPMAVVTLEDKRLEDECRELRGRIAAFDAKSDDVKRIHFRDLFKALEFLGKPTNKVEVENMLWEVDEDIDGSVSWQEFQLMFRRNLADKTGLEPSQLFSVVQFLMYDRDFTGMVSLDQTMHMLYNRYGKERLEAEMKVRRSPPRTPRPSLSTLALDIHFQGKGGKKSFLTTHPHTPNTIWAATLSALRRRFLGTLLRATETQSFPFSITSRP
jgi:calmodulin